MTIIFEDYNVGLDFIDACNQLNIKVGFRESGDLLIARVLRKSEIDNLLDCPFRLNSPVTKLFMLMEKGVKV